MIIDVLCDKAGSTVGVTSHTLWGDGGRIGVGGSEYQLITICEEWVKRGHTVRVYNNPTVYGASPFEQCSIDSFNPKDDRDVLMVFRTPDPKAALAKGLKVWWSHDQFTTGDFKLFAPLMDKIVCNSPFHANFFKTVYGIKKTIVIDEMIRLDDYKDQSIERENHKFLFASVPDRGLQHLWRMWPRVLELYPDAHLTITSDYRLWNAAALNEKHRIKWVRVKNVEFMGAVPRKKLIEEQLKSDVLLYPCEYDELFCIVSAESAVSGVYPITSGVGALATTTVGTIVNYDPKNSAFDKHYIQATADFLDSPDKEKIRKDTMEKSQKRFSPERILKIWDEKVFK